MRMRLQAVQGQSPESRPGAACLTPHQSISLWAPSGKLTRNNIVSPSALRGRQSTITNCDNASRRDFAQVPRIMSDQASPHGGASQCFLLVQRGLISHSQLPSLAQAATSHLQAVYALPAGRPTPILTTRAF